MCIIIKLEKGWTGVGFKVRINTTCSLLPSQTQQPVERSHKHKWRHWDPLPEEGKYSFQTPQPASNNTIFCPWDWENRCELQSSTQTQTCYSKGMHYLSVWPLCRFSVLQLSGSPVPVFEKVRRVSFIKQVPVFLSIHFEFLLLKADTKTRSFLSFCSSSGVRVLSLRPLDWWREAGLDSSESDSPVTDMTAWAPEN